MTEELTEALVNLGKTKLAKVRDVVSDLVATVHMINSNTANQPWICECPSCEYVRQTPKVMEAIQNAIIKSNKIQ